MHKKREASPVTRFPIERLSHCSIVKTQAFSNAFYVYTTFPPIRPFLMKKHTA